MADIIKHAGIIEEIKGPHIQVKIIQTSACSACKVQGICNASESKEKVIDIYDKNSTEHFKGEQVMLVGTTSMGLKAVMLGFGIPFVIMIAVLFGVMSLTEQNESLSALISLLALVPYYLILFFNRGKLSKEFSFSIESIQ